MARCGEQLGYHYYKHAYFEVNHVGMESKSYISIKSKHCKTYNIRPTWTSYYQSQGCLDVRKMINILLETFLKFSSLQ